MPKVLKDYSDERNKAWCVHCGSSLSETGTTRDHTPSKVLLNRPLPNDLAVTPICGPCNRSFSMDEEYFASFLSAVLSGTCDPEQQVIKHCGKAMKRSAGLRKLIEGQRVEQFCFWGPSDLRWFPDLSRFRNVILKNARAHLFYENGEPMTEAPAFVEFSPLSLMDSAQKNEFFEVNYLQPWCEVGSRWNTRLIEGDEFDEWGFLVVQPETYRFRIDAGGLGVRSIIREYLATSVFWEC